MSTQTITNPPPPHPRRHQPVTVSINQMHHLVRLVIQNWINAIFVGIKFKEKFSNRIKTMSSYKKLSTFGEKKSEVDSLLPNILRIEDKTALIQNYKVVVIDVHADWCGPCKIVSPLFSELFKKYNIPGVCILAKENVDLKLSPSIQVVPTFQFFLY